MSPLLSVSSCLASAARRRGRLRSALLLGLSLLALVACGGGAGATTLTIRPVADTSPGSASSPLPTPTADSVPTPAATPTPAPAATDAPAPVVAGAHRPPSPRYGPAVAYDAAREDLVLFGGGDDQTFIWRDHRWTQVFPQHSPPARTWAEMAYDPKHRDVVLFGGSAGGGARLTDTWLWDGTDWTEASPAFTPQATIEEGMTYFAGTGTVLMYSGTNMGPNHVSSWDGRNWTDLPFPAGPPSGVFQGGFSVDPVRDVVVLTADDANAGIQGHPTLAQWEFDGRTWTHFSAREPCGRVRVMRGIERANSSGGTGFPSLRPWP